MGERAFVLRREAGLYVLRHRDTAARMLTVAPYFDLWPIQKTPTRWVVTYRILGLTFNRLRWARKRGPAWLLATMGNLR